MQDEYKLAHMYVCMYVLRIFANIKIIYGKFVEICPLAKCVKQNIYRENMTITTIHTRTDEYT